MPESVIAALESVIAARALVIAAQVRGMLVVATEQAPDRSIAVVAPVGRLVVARLHKRATSAAAVLPAWRARARLAVAGAREPAEERAPAAADAAVAADERNPIRCDRATERRGVDEAYRYSATLGCAWSA